MLAPAENRHRAVRPGTCAARTCILLLPFAGKMRRSASGWAALLFSAAVAGQCRSGGGAERVRQRQRLHWTATDDEQFDRDATSGALSHTTTLTLTVQ